MNDNAKQAREIFMEISELASTERDQALEQACAGDADLRAQVETLLRAMIDAEGFMGQPTADDMGSPTLSIDHLAKPSQSAVSEEGIGQQIGHYKLLEQIGEGGFGSVWAAEQKVPVKRRVALKIIKLGMDTKQVIARFEAERQALAMMDHPNIAKVLDAGATDNGRPYFVMELVKGVPILEYCDREKLNTKSRLNLFTLVCHAIQHAHQKGIIHRDIKPGNVLVTMHDGVPVPKVIDFGIAKATTAELTQMTIYTQHHQMVGTPAYMSPEQAEMSGLDIDTRSDIYSLGVLLYELLTGTTPFAHQELMERGFGEMMRIIREEIPHKPSTRLSSLGETGTRTAEQRHTDIRKLGLVLRGDLDWIVMKCLEKDRTRRYDTANGLAADIVRHLSDEPVVAGPPSAGYKISKFIKRNRGQVIAGGAIAAILILGVVGTTSGMLWAIDEKTQAKAAAESERIAKQEAQENAQRAQAAEAEALARATELEQVAEFQSEQLGAIDPEMMGVQLRLSLLDSLPEDERALLSETLAPVNFTNIAMGTLEDNIFQNTIDAINTQFAEQPLVRARLLQTTADTLADLGLHQIAMEPQSVALDIRREELGEEHADTLYSLLSISNLYVAQNRLPEAISNIRSILSIQQRTLGEDDPDTLLSVWSLGATLRRQGELDEAEQYIRQALLGQRRVLGDAHEDTLSSMNSLAVLLGQQGKIDEQEGYYKEVLAGYRLVKGNDDPATLNSIANMGVFLLEQGKVFEAEPYVREALERSRRVLGDNHPDTLRALHSMGGLLQEQGMFAEAEPYFRESLDGVRRLLGDDHPSTLNIKGGIGLLYQQMGKLSDAEPFLRESYEGLRRVLGDDRAEILTSMNNLGLLFEAQGELSEAESWLRKALEGYRRVLGDEHRLTLGTMINLGEVLQKQGKLSDAEPYLREAMEVTRRVLGDDDPITLKSISSLGSLLNNQGEFVQAEAYFREAGLGLRRVLGDDHPQTLTWMNKMSMMLMNLGKHPEAELLAREALDARREMLGEDHPDTLNATVLVGMTLQQQGIFEEAAEYYRVALDGRRRVLGNDHTETLTSIFSLGSLYRKLGMLSEAEPYLLELVEGDRRVHGDDHPETAASIEALGQLRHQQGHASEEAGKQAEALSYYLQSFELLRVDIGSVELAKSLPGMTSPDHPVILELIVHIGDLSTALGKLSEAEQLYRSELMRSRTVYGEDHIITLALSIRLGVVLRERGNLEQAETYLRNALEGFRRINGEEDPVTLDLYAGLGWTLLLQEKYKESEEMYSVAYEGQRSVLGIDDPMSLTSLMGLARTIELQDRLVEAEPFYRETFAGRKRLHGETHTETLTAVNNLAHNLNNQGKFDEALELLMKYEPAVRATWIGANNGNYLMKIGFAQTGVGQHAQAEATLLEAYPIVLEGFGKDHAKTKTCITRLVDLYTAWHASEPGNGYDNDADEWRKKRSSINEADNP